MSMITCPHCGNFLIQYGNELVCSHCGIVIDNYNISFEPEWRSFNLEQEQQRSRAGVPNSPAVIDNGLSTIIGADKTDAFGKKIPFKKRAKFFRMKKWQFRSKVYESINRNLNQATSELKLVSEMLNLTPIVTEEASVIYKEALLKGLVRGRSINAMVAASIYLACRVHQIPRSIVEICNVSKADKKDITRCYRLLISKLEVKISTPDPKKRVPRVVEQLNLSRAVEQTAIDILRQAEEKKITIGKDTNGLVAASIYIACLLNKEKRPQKEIAKATGITEVTIRNRYKDLIKQLNIKI